MTYTCPYVSPLGEILLAADDLGLTGLWFAGQKYFPSLEPHCQEALPVFQSARQWLDLYFAGKNPDFTPPLHLTGTPFQQQVWQILLTIPYGETVTYGEIAKKLRCKSAQAVGGAVGHNPISILVPCHRVLGAKGNLTGYAGGLERKTYLLNLEKKSVQR